MVDQNRNLDREEIGRKGGVGGTTGTMQRDTVGENVREGWQNLRSKIRGKWNQLTDKDLDTYQNRNRDDLVGFIGERVGGDRTAIGRDVDNFARETNYRWR
jgi:hypothetical protein